MALPVLAAELKIAYPEFAGVSDDVVDYWVGQADEEIAPLIWGTRAKKGEMALACHMMILAGVSIAEGAVGIGSAVGGQQSVKVGDVAVGFGASTAIAVQVQGLDPSLALSRYGLEYARLLKTLLAGAAVI